MATKRSTGYQESREGTSEGYRNVTVSFNEISEPGAYYNHETGWLYRIPEDMLSLGHSPFMNIVSGHDNFVTKISSDPWIPLNKARQLCANRDFAVNF